MTGMGRDPEIEIDLGDDPPLDDEGGSAVGPDHLSQGLRENDLQNTFGLAELAAQLESDPEEWAEAVEGLESLDPETRAQVIRGLGGLPRTPGVGGLLERLAASEMEEIRDEARQALHPARPGRETSRELVRITRPAGPCIVASLVTPVDGDGKATIGLSASFVTERRTALFRCDINRGITGAVGQLEPEGSEAGALLREFQSQGAGAPMLDDPELARELLAGCLLLNGPFPSTDVTHWLSETVGADFRPRPFRASPESPREAPRQQPSSRELLAHAGRLLDECPDWLDRSALTFELAEEVHLREGTVAADPRRDAGAFRYLFEHRLLGRLELYRRMLVWMGRYWECFGRRDLARWAGIFAAQLSDEQFAVPGHPFAQTLMARSLDAARKALGTDGDPRKLRR